MKLFILHVLLFCFSLNASAQIQSDYSRIYGFVNGYARVVKDGKIGFIDTSLNEVIPCQFKWANNFYTKSQLATVTDSNKRFGYINRAGELIVPYQYSSVYYFEEESELVYVKRDGKFGWMDKNGKEVIPCIYNQTTGTPEHFYNGLARMKKDGKYGILNTKGETIVEFEYDYFYGFNWLDGFPKNYMVVKKNGEYTYLNMKTYKDVPYQYDYAGDFHEGFAKVKKDGKYGYIDTSFNLIIPYQYIDAEDFSESLVAVKNDQEKWGVINSSGDTLVDFKYYSIEEFEDGIASVRITKEQAGYINHKGKEITASDLHRIPYDNDGNNYPHIELCSENGCQLANKKGRIKSKHFYTNLMFVNQYRLHTDVIIDTIDNYCLGVRDSLFYAINRKGKELNKTGSKEMLFFYNGFALIRNKDEKVGFINTKGKLVVPFEFEYYYFYHFINGHSIIKKDGKFGMINTQGEVAIPFEYDRLSHFNSGYASGKQGEQYVLINQNMEVVLKSR